MFITLDAVVSEPVPPERIYSFSFWYFSKSRPVICQVGVCDISVSVASFPSLTVCACHTTSGLSFDNVYIHLADGYWLSVEADDNEVTLFINCSNEPNVTVIVVSSILVKVNIPVIGSKVASFISEPKQSPPTYIFPVLLSNTTTPSTASVAEL